MFFTGHDAGIGCFQLIQGQNKAPPIFGQKKRPPRANPRRSENPLFMRFISDYSMIVATLPEPTVLPPSRYQTGVLLCANGDFSCDLCGKIRIFRCVRVVFGDFVIMVVSPNVRYSYYALCGNIFLISSTSLPGSEPFL